MNTETLRTFLKLTEVRNYTQTASQLFVAQSTVTNRIFELENELGFSLFVRERKNLKLTAAGEHFLDYARRIVELEQSAVSELSNLNHYVESLRIGSTNTIYDCHLVQPVLLYQKKHPDISLSISINHSLPLIQMLQDHTLDMVFTYVPHKRNPIHSTVFATDPLVLVTCASNTAYRAGIHQAKLLEIPYYYCDFPFQELGGYIKNLFPKNHPFPLTMDRSANLLPFLTNGNGYSFLPRSLIAPLLADGQLIEIATLDFDVPPVNCYVEYCEDTPVLARIREFTELLDTNRHPSTAETGGTLPPCP